MPTDARRPCHSERMPHIVSTVNLASLALILGVASACGDSESNSNGDDGSAGAGGSHGECTGGQTYSAGMSKTGSVGLGVRIVNADPAPPLPGYNVWTIELLDADGEAALGEITKVEPWMPTHGHGSNLVPRVVEEDGRYIVDDLNFTMVGLWDVEFTFEVGGVVDSVEFSFCVGS
jgi:hypothetical protein